MIAFVFPGQGSQKKGMGAKLFKKYPEYVEIADKALGYSIEELCLENPDNKLNLTEYTQAAIFIVNALTYMDYVEKAKIEPDFVAGHSLGEYNALFAAKVFDFETGIKLVRMRGKLMGKVSGGGMAAVLGLPGERVQEICNEHPELYISVANYNTDTQIIIAGEKENVMNSREVFTEIEGVRFSPLNVSGAFHSPYMNQPRMEFEKFISDFRLEAPLVPIIANLTGKEYEGEDLAHYLIEQMNSSVRWSDTVKYLMDKGVRHFVEIGQSTVLTQMIENIRKVYVPIKTETLNKAEEMNATFHAEKLGSNEFRSRYNIRYSYLVGGMYQAISSREMIISLANSNILGFYGTGGLKLDRVEEDIKKIKSMLQENKPYGVNVISNMGEEDKENSLISYLLKVGVRTIEASGYIYITKPIVKYRARGISLQNGVIKSENHIIAKVSRPEVAEFFMSPAPENIINSLLSSGDITKEQAECLRIMPVASDISVEADSGGHTDLGVTTVLIPAIKRMRDHMMAKHRYSEYIHIGAAGGIGTPESAGVAFLLGADFIMTGSINQCTVEAGTSDFVKDMLEDTAVQDTEYAPAGDMLEFGSKVQVLKKGTFFPARANKLYDIFKHHSSLSEFDEATKNQIENVYFKKKISQIVEEEKDYLKNQYPEELKKLETDEKYKLLTVLKWYFRNSTIFAIAGNSERKVDFQVQCGKAMGAFNDWIKGTEFERWENRTTVGIANLLMNETANYLNNIMKKGV
jgi:trans-AT polyketide synthase/acyltransferase/oxidoreductase domain-containing protein